MRGGGGATRVRGVWIFAYGSLLFRPGFDYAERRRAFVDGYERRLWQGSPDHRGVPEAPGLLPRDTAVCGGAAYRVSPSGADAILRALDEREQAGFARVTLPLLEAPGGRAFAQGVTWIAGPENPHYLGELPEPAIAAQVRARRGPSGENADYVRLVAEALRALGIEDAHLEAIVAGLG